jgi:hypothetical protein
MTSYPREHLMVQEYRALREEMAANRRFIFERPIFIITAGIAGLFGLSRINDPSPEMLLYAIALAIPCLGLLYFNLWFTANRLRSTARIVAYLQLVHEPGDGSPYAWIGWENDLRKWRLLERQRTRQRPFPPRLSRQPKKSIRSFYQPIFLLHLGAGIFIGVLLGLGLLLMQKAEILPSFTVMSWRKLALVATGFLAPLVYVVACGREWRSDARHGIERHRRGWEMILTHGSSTKGVRGSSTSCETGVTPAID